MKQLKDLYVKKVDKKLCKTEWQEFAKQTVQEFQITGWAKAKIFKAAKSNIHYLKRCVVNVKEKATYEKKELSTYAGLLIWIISKKK